MDCPECQIAEDFHGYRLFNPLCLHCGARLVQLLGTLAITKAECSRRRVAVMDDWQGFGHSREEIRTLAKGAIALPSQAAPTVFDPLKSRKRKAKA